MKLSIGLTAALAGCAAAAQQAAQVYMFRNDASPSSSTPAVSPSLARLILLQRLAARGNGPSTDDLPSDIDVETAVELMNEYAVKGFSIGETATDSPYQAVVMIDGFTEDQMDKMNSRFDMQPAFTIEAPPSSSASDKFIKNDLYNVGVTNGAPTCALEFVLNPTEPACWSGKSTVAKYSIQKQPEILDELLKTTSNLASLASSGEMETTVVLLPASGQASKWSDKIQELRRRQSPAEQVISDYEPVVSEAPTSDSTITEDPSSLFYASTEKIPACFGSEESCQTSTGNCSGHGSCLNKYAKADGSEGKESCYVCHCLSTVSDSGSLTHWAGSTCAKKDVSVAFWLFAGFTIIMVGILTLSISMLFSVGEEKLPGVIGAGVSKSSK